MNDRFKFRVWDKEEKILHYDAEKTYDCLAGRPIIGAQCFNDLIVLDNFILEQCTGLKDKNGNLIYEGDVICDRGEIAGVCDEPFVVIWSDRCVSFMLDGKTGMRTHCASLDAADAHNYEIVGNVHEQKEQQ